METATLKLEDVVNQLIEICRDGEKGFETAAKAVSDAELKSELMRYSLQRRDFAIDLERALEDLGQDPIAHGSIVGVLRRGWIHLTRIAGEHTHAILAVCERGEDEAMEVYRHALNESLPGSLEDMVGAQYRVISTVHDRIRTLRDGVDRS
jgi:uncharacterized protein (TIGR02284 family)